MKILYNVQVSNFTIINDVRYWLIGKDACTNLCRGIVENLIKIDDSLHFIIKLPLLEHVYDIKNYYELFDKEYHNNIEFYYEDIPIHPIESRFNFNFNYHKENRKYFENVDVCINDENTLTRNWSCLFNQLGLDIPIISTNYYLDSPILPKVPEECGYYERQMESFIHSNISAFQCKATMNESLEALKCLYLPNIVDKVKNKSSVWGVGGNASEIWKYKNIHKFETPTIFFSNRITEASNRYTQWHKFAEAIGYLTSLHMINTPFRAIMLNPTDKVTIEQKDEIDSLSNGKIELFGKNFTRDDYLKFINQSHIACGLFTLEQHGGLSHIEAMLANNIVCMPYINNYSAKFPIKDEYDYWCELLPDGTIDAQSLAKAMAKALNIIGTQEEIRINNLLRERAYELESYEMAAPRILKDLKYLIEK